MKQPLQEQDYIDASKLLNCEIACIKAVTQVESGGFGFLADDRPKILFEAKYFHSLTNGKYDKTNPNISSPIWDRALYKGGTKEWDRMNEAIKLDKNAALQSASYGGYQIMGANYKACGFNSVQEFYDDMCKDSKSHLLAFCNFLKSNGLDKKLIAHDWAGFAAGYNGPRYKENNYDTKISNAYNTFKLQEKTKIPSPKDIPNYINVEKRGTELWGNKK